MFSCLLKLRLETNTQRYVMSHGSDAFAVFYLRTVPSRISSNRTTLLDANVTP